MLCLMLIGPISLIFVVLLPAAVAQETGSVEGRVASSTAHTGIGGVTVSVASQRATTDPSGTFHFTGLPPGNHTFSFEASGFFKLETKLRVDSGITAAHLDIELIPHSSISGRVLDEEGNSVAGVRVEITQAVRGTGTTWSVWGDVTDSEGRYRMDAMPTGKYLAMARPNPRILGGLAGNPPKARAVQPPKARDGEQRTWVRTYFPSVSDRSQAARLVLRGGTQLGADIRLLAVPVYAIRGMIYDDGGKPVNASVSLAAPEALEMPEAQAQAHDGAFEFPQVPSGEWRVMAEADSGGRKLRGWGPALLNRHDMENVTVRLAAPFALPAMVEPRELGESAAIELYPTDAPASLAAFSKRGADGTLQFPAIYPGRYRVNVYATIPDHYLDSVRIGEQDVLGKEVMFAEGMPAVRVVFKPNSARVRGTVENCGGASILLLPEDEGLWDFRFIRRGSCDSSGHFEFGGLRPGNYYTLALDRLESTGLDDLSTLRRLASMGAQVPVDSGRSAYVELKLAHWPE